jgi:hypothetical protein
MYLYNARRFDRDMLLGDQWVWVRDVLMPFEQGRMSLHDAVTAEYATLSHSHIPTLSAFLANANLLGLDLTVDVMVGVLSLVAIAVIVHRHAAQLPSISPWPVIAAATSLLFMSSNYRNFAWSLLQFQMFYVLVAVFYLYRFAKQVEDPRPFHALVVVPATLVLGDAIGVAAVVSSLAYLGSLALLRRVRVRKVALHFAAFPIHLFLLGRLLTGTRAHGEISLRTFLEIARDRPVDLLQAGAEGLAGALFAFQADPPSALPVLSWDWAWLGVVATLVLVVGGTIGLLRARLEPSDHFPLMLTLASAIWVAGVLRSRFWLAGTDVMRAPRFFPYTALLGLGLILLVAGKWQVLRRWRYPVAAVISLAVAVNAITSLALTLDDEGERRQDVELASLLQYVEGSIEAPVQSGRQCKLRTPCLEAAWYLWDEGLGPFAEQPSDAEGWVPDLRASVFAEIRSLAAVPLRTRCDRLPTAPDEEVLEHIESRGAMVPDDGRGEAVAIYRRAFEVECAAVG